MSKIANLLLQIAELLKSRSSNGANYFLNLAQNVAHKDGAKMKVILPEGDGPIQYRYESTNGDVKNGWDNYYANAGLFLQGKAQELELDLHTDDLEVKFDTEDIREIGVQLTDKAELEKVVNAKLADNLWGFAQGGNKQEQLNYIIIGGLALVILMMWM